MSKDFTKSAILKKQTILKAEKIRSSILKLNTGSLVCVIAFAGAHLGQGKGLPEAIWWSAVFLVAGVAASYVSMYSSKQVSESQHLITMSEKEHDRLKYGRLAIFFNRVEEFSLWLSFFLGLAAIIIGMNFLYEQV